MKKFEEYVVSKVSKPVQTSMGHCHNCGCDTLEGKTDETGYWHYRCQTCVDQADPHYIFKEEIPCPKCGCTAHIGIGSNAIEHPLKPDVSMHECLNCEHRFYTEDYIRYMLSKNIVSIIKKSETTLGDFKVNKI